MLEALIRTSGEANDQLALGARLSALSYGVAALGGILWIVMVFAKFLVHPLLRFLESRSLDLGIKRSLSLLFTWLLLFVYGASWAKFWHTGKFLSHEDFLFIAPHPLQVFHWINPDIVVGVFLLTIAAAVLMGWWIPRQVTSWKPLYQQRLLLISGGAALLFLAEATIGELYSGFGTRRYLRSASLYAKERDENSGPAAHLIANFRRLARRQSLETSGTDAVNISRRPIISMQQYLSGIEPSRLKRWNVIVLVVESMRADQLRTYEANRDVMPAVNQLAAQSRVFANSYTQASHTDYATLVPLSSHYPLRSQIIIDYPQNPTYPRVLIYDVLKALGYHTAIFSSSNEYWAGMINYLQTGNIDRFFHAATFSGPTQAMQEDTGFARWVKQTRSAGSVDDSFTTAEAIKWIDAQKKEPFFVYMNFQNSHVPYIVPANFPRRFSPGKLDFTIRFGHIPKDKVGIAKDVYADSLSYVDAQIAKLLRYLTESGLWDRTVIVLTGDHGEGFYEHGFTAHGSDIFNEVMKVPLIIYAPELASGLDDRPAQHVDIAPSVFALLGLPAHPSFQGINLFAADTHQNRSIYMVAQTPLAHQYGIVRSGMKLIYDEWEGHDMLYDLKRDPGEKNEIGKENPSVVRELATRLNLWRKLQLEYYTNKNIHTHEYPPVIED